MVVNANVLGDSGGPCPDARKVDFSGEDVSCNDSTLGFDYFKDPTGVCVCGPVPCSAFQQTRERIFLRAYHKASVLLDATHSWEAPLLSVLLVRATSWPGHVCAQT